MTAAILVLSGIAFSSCSNKDASVIDSPDPTPSEQKAKWTVIVYGQTGAEMDALVESVYEVCKPLMTSPDVRLFFCYQYGKDEVRHGQHTFNAKYAGEGDVLFFELTKDTDLTKLAASAKDGSQWSLTNPANLTEAINEAVLRAPAQNYSLVIYGHGVGFDVEVDCPDALRTSPTRATLYDTWNQQEGGTGAMSMYNLSAAISNSSVRHFNTLFFHSCLMGNIECLSNVYTCADNLVTSAHVLVGVNCILEEYIRGLYQQPDAEKAIAQMFEKCYDEWKTNHYMDETMSLGFNGDMSLVKSAELPEVMAVLGRLQKRIVELYPTEKEAIHQASDKVYSYLLMKGIMQMDMQNYADLLAANTGDDQLKAIAAELRQALGKALPKRMMTVGDPFFKLPEFGLSLVLAKNTTYGRTFAGGYTFQQAYEASEFHKRSGWGNWLKLNTRDVSRSFDSSGNIRIGNDDAKYDDVTE